MQEKRFISEAVLRALSTDSLTTVSQTIAQAKSTVIWLLERHNPYLSEHFMLQLLAEDLGKVLEELDKESDERQLDLFKIGGSI